MKGCQQKNQKSQKLFYERFYAYALKTVFRYIYRFDRCVDVVHDGFVKIFNNMDSFQRPDGDDYDKVLFGWIRRIMINTAIDHLRKNHMLPEIGGIPPEVWEEPDKSGNADQIVLYKDIINEIKKLPPSYRTVFNMFVIDGLSHQEIADLLHISVGTSKSSLSKARAHLQKYINEHAAQADRYAVNSESYR